MDEKKIRDIIRRPTGGRPVEKESDHFEQCPGCGGWFDCRNLDEVLSHLGPHKAEPKQ